MTNSTTPAVSIGSDPVLVDASDAQKSTPDESLTTMKDNVSETSSDDSDWEGSVTDFVTREGNIPRPFRQGRGRPARFIPDRDMTDIPIISNTKQFNALLSEPDICVETVGSCEVTYITTTPFHNADLQKLAWLFKSVIPDTWVHKSTRSPHARPPYYGNGTYDDPYRREPRDLVPHARLGAALRIFKDDSEKYGTSKVKFVTAVQGNAGDNGVKLIVSYTRQAATVDIFHQILNNQSILFVGAVLCDVAVPVEAAGRKHVKVQRVNSVKEAEDVGKGVIGVIC